MSTVSVDTSAATRNATTNQSHLDLGLLLLRVVPFGVLAIFGAQKLFGVFGGGGLTATGAYFAQLGYHPPLLFALLGGGSELVGGLLLMAGLFVPLGTAMVMGVMINAYMAVADKPLETTALPVIVFAIALGLAFSGPGRYSVDAGRPWQRTGLVWGGASLALAVIAAVPSLLVAS